MYVTVLPRLVRGPVHETPSGRWEYRGLKPKESSYVSIRRPQITLEGKVYNTAKLIWEYVLGPIADGLHMLHKCDNPRCVRLDHLYPGTESDNARDRDTRGRRIKYRTSLRRLSAEQIRVVRQRVGAGERVYKVAAEFHVAAKVIYQIVQRVTYSDVD